MSKDSSLRAINESALLNHLPDKDEMITMKQKNQVKDDVVKDINEQVLKLDLKENQKHKSFVKPEVDKD